jgi:hypothetical protein
MQRLGETMPWDLPWTWIGMTALAVATMRGLWWALADLILDRVGPAPTEWRGQGRP